MAKYHSTLHDFSWIRYNLRERAAHEEGLVEVNVGGSECRIGSSNVIYNPYPHPELRHKAWYADAVVVGIPKDPLAYFTDDGGFIFTDYALTVEEVLKQNAAAPIGIGNDIIVTRVGGELLLDGKVVRARDGRFRPIDLGHRYLFFLRFIPATGGFLAHGSGTFELIEAGSRRGARVMAAKTQWQSLESESDALAFLNEIRAAVAATHSTRRRVGSP